MREISFIPLGNSHYDMVRDESRLVGEAEWISFPKNERELEADVLKAKKNEYKITVRGSGTGVVGGCVPKGGAIIDLSQYNTIRGIQKKSKEKYIVSLDAGVTLQTLNEFLASSIPPVNFTKEDKAIFLEMREKGDFHFPPNPSEETATIGGIYATNASGTNKLGYGKTSNYFHKITGFLSDGNKIIIDNNAKIIEKENKIYILDREFDMKNISSSEREKNSYLVTNETRTIDALAGSEGSLFIISETEIIINKAPESHWGVHYFFENQENLFSFADFLLRWRDKSEDFKVLLSCEYYDDASLRLIERQKELVSSLKKLSDFPKNSNGTLFLELGGSEEKVEEVLEEHFNGFLEAGGKEEDTWAVDQPNEVKAFHDLRHTLPEIINTLVDNAKKSINNLTKMGMDFTGPKESLIIYAKMYRDDIMKNSIEGYIFGHILENHYHVNLIPKNKEEKLLADKIIEKWAKKVINDGGSLVSESGVGRLKKDIIEKHTSKNIIQYIKEIKSSFDGENRLGQEVNII